MPLSRSECHQFLFLVRIFNAPAGRDSIHSNPFLAWLERERLATLTSMPISHSSWNDATKPWEAGTNQNLGASF
jgi:hypothetical protein